MLALLSLLLPLLQSCRLMYDLPSGEADVSGTLVDLFDDEDLEMMWEELDVMLVRTAGAQLGLGLSCACAPSKRACRCLQQCNSATVQCLAPSMLECACVPGVLVWLKRVWGIGSPSKFEVLIIMCLVVSICPAGDQAHL
jgi:hypothetical protein